MKQIDKPHVMMYTDGSYIQNKYGGYSALLDDGWGRPILIMGGNYGTNQFNELYAIVAGLDCLTVSCNVTIVSDSKYAINGIMHWTQNWIRNGWKTKKGSEVVNRELWERLNIHKQNHNLTMVWQKSHTGGDSIRALGNDVVDVSAQFSARQISNRIN